MEERAPPAAEEGEAALNHEYLRRRLVRLQGVPARVRARVWDDVSIGEPTLLFRYSPLLICVCVCACACVHVTLGGTYRRWRRSGGTASERESRGRPRARAPLQHPLPAGSPGVQSNVRGERTHTLVT